MRWWSALAAWRDRLAARSRRVPRTVWLGLLASLFVVAAWLATDSLSLGWEDIRWGPLVAATLVGVPATAAANALEYAASARLLGHRVSFLPALRVSILATAANLLPLPGGVLVRLHALRREGVGTSHAVGATAVIGLVWVTVALLPAGGIALSQGHRYLGAMALVAGGLTAATSAVVVGRLGHRLSVARWYLRVVAIELLSVGASALRIFLLLRALSVPAGPEAAIVLALAVVLSTSLGVLPAGLGVKEALSGVLATAVALPAALGVVVSVLDRVVGLAVHAPLSLLLARTDRRRQVGTPS